MIIKKKSRKKAFSCNFEGVFKKEFSFFQMLSTVYFAVHHLNINDIQTSLVNISKQYHQPPPSSFSTGFLETFSLVCFGCLDVS